MSQLICANTYATLTKPHFIFLETISLNLLFTFNHQGNLEYTKHSSSLAVTKRHHRPFPAPSPFARPRVPSATGQLTQPLIFARRETDDGIGFAGSKG